jgi:predicted membrane-bound spermidine synthase
MSIRELIFGVLPEPLDLAYWFLVIDLSDPRNWFIGELQPVELYDFA